MIGVSVVNPLMLNHGWPLNQDFAGATGDRLYNLTSMYELYLKANPNYSGRVTVPVLWDQQEETIVSNESADIIRMFNSAFDEVGATAGDSYPVALRTEIDAFNARIYDRVNNGVYKAGFATQQAAYQEAVEALFAELDALEHHLSAQRWLVGAQITEADWRLFTTLLRFDPVYVGHFKCNLRRIADYPNLSAYLRDLYQQPGIASTCNMEHIKHHYYRSHPTINPTGIVPQGPRLDLNAPHDRAERFAESRS
jgi:putative glutathione S-transferase